MKKRLISLIAILSLVGGSLAFASVVSNTKGPGDILGQGKQIYEPGKIFRIVRYVPAGGNANHPTLTADSVLVWDTTSDDGVTVTTTTTSPDSAVAGVAPVAILTPDVLGRTVSADALYGGRNWGWLQTYGLCTVNVDATNSVVAGGAIGTSTTPGSVGPYTASTTDTTKMGKLGFAFDTGAAAVTGLDAFVNLD